MSLFELHERPDLDAPVLIQALEGWIDAGLGAGLALRSILESTETVTVASFDTDELLDHRARRPTMHLVDGVNRGLTWPSLELRAASDRAGKDVLFLVGAEPDHRWRAFSTAAVDLALEFGVRQVVGLGAYPAPVPHTQPTRLVATATDDDWAERVGFVRGAIDVPAGVQAAVERRCAEVSLQAVGLWAQVPHYAATMPYPAAGAALVDGLRDIIGLSFDGADLHADAVSTRTQLDQLVAQNPDHQQLVQQLEQAVEDLGGGPGDGSLGEDLPSGDELAAELQEFLREQGDD